MNIFKEIFWFGEVCGEVCDEEYGEGYVKNMKDNVSILLQRMICCQDKESLYIRCVEDE